MWPSFKDSLGNRFSVEQLLERHNQLASNYARLEEELATLQGENKRLAAELAEATTKAVQIDRLKEDVAALQQFRVRAVSEKDPPAKQLCDLLEFALCTHAWAEFGTAVCELRALADDPDEAVRRAVKLDQALGDLPQCFPRVLAGLYVELLTRVTRA